jgi:DNA modification methylase
MEVNKIYQGDSSSVLQTFEDKIFNCCVTSPPYYGLRDYGCIEQIGLEKTPELYVSKLVEVFREVKRVLKNDGTLWLNLGDSYWGSGQEYGDTKTTNKGHDGSRQRQKPKWGDCNLKPKDLIGIPWMVAFALRADGWYLRDEIIWNKPNPMPESVTDRCTKAHETIFLLSKSKQYYFDYKAIRTPMAQSSLSRLSQDVENQEGSDRVPNKTNGKMKAVGMFVGGKKHKNMEYDGQLPNSFHATRNSNGQEWQSDDGMANKRNVWTVCTKPYKEAHFATYPEELIVDMIKAGCPKGGIVLDPFAGANTTGLVARKLNRNYVAIELNPEYIKIGKNRVYDQIGLFL